MTEPGAGALLGALLAIQGEVPTLQKSAVNPHFKSRYVPLDELHEVVLPIVHKHGCVWTTLPGAVDGTPVLHYRLVHVESGEVLDGAMPLLCKQDPQGQGSAITYARRYSLMAVLGLVADVDADGNRSKQEEELPESSIPPALLKDLRDGYRVCGWDEAELRSQLVSVGCQDTTDVKAAMRSLKPSQAEELKKAMSAAVDALEMVA